MSVAWVFCALGAAAVTGLADYAEVDGNARTRATVHGTLMVVTLVLYTLSLVIRSGNSLRTSVNSASGTSSTSSS